MNKHRFFSSISFVRISYKTIWLKTWSWYKSPLKNEIWKGLNLFFPKDLHQKSEGVNEVRFKKNSTPSPWKRRKTTSSATLCATGVWGLNFYRMKRASWDLKFSALTEARKNNFQTSQRRRSEKSAQIGRTTPDRITVIATVSKSSILKTTVQSFPKCSS